MSSEQTLQDLRKRTQAEMVKLRNILTKTRLNYCDKYDESNCNSPCIWNTTENKCSNDLEYDQLYYEIICSVLNENDEIYKDDVVRLAKLYNVEPNDIKRGSLWNKFGLIQWSDLSKKDICLHMASEFKKIFGFVVKGDMSDDSIELQVKRIATRIHAKETDIETAISIGLQEAEAGSDESTIYNKIKNFLETKYGKIIAIFLGVFVIGVVIYILLHPVEHIQSYSFEDESDSNDFQIENRTKSRTKQYNEEESSNSTLFGDTSDNSSEGERNNSYNSNVTCAKDNIPCGVKENPVICKDRIDLAAKYLSKGMHVQLNQPDEISTLVEMIGSYDTSKITFNLADISVPGTNLFAQENLGIPRVKMPQFTGRPEKGSLGWLKLKPGQVEVDLTNEFMDFLKGNNFTVTETQVLPDYLRATQSELDGAKIYGMARAIKAGKIPPAPIFVTKDKYILDGHHRWAANVVLDFQDGVSDSPMPVRMIDTDIGTVLGMANDFTQEWGIAPKGLGAAAEGIVRK